MSGQASALRNCKRKKRRERDEVFGAEAWMARTWWMVIDPAVPVHGTARVKSRSTVAGSIAPQNLPSAW